MQIFVEFNMEYIYILNWGRYDWSGDLFTTESIFTLYCKVSSFDQ